MKLFLSLLLPQLAGIIGALFTINAIPQWYVFLNKPSFSPPNWLFAPVWTTLYLLMGISLYLNWIKKERKARENVKLFFLQLAINAIWTPVFFGAKNIFLALMIIIILWMLIVAMIFRFYKINKASSLILIPYLIWVSFATILNYFIWKLN